MQAMKGPPGRTPDIRLSVLLPFSAVTLLDLSVLLPFSAVTSFRCNEGHPLGTPRAARVPRGCLASLEPCPPATVCRGQLLALVERYG